MASKKEDGERDPFGGMDVVDKLTGGALSVHSAKLNDTAMLIEEERRRREKQAKLRAMKPWQRRKYERDSQRVRLTLYIPEPLSRLINALAKQESTSPSSAAAWLIAVGLRKWDEGEVEQPRFARARSIRVSKSILLPEEWDGKRRERTFDLPDLKADIYRLSKLYDCGRSDIAAWLMSIGASAYKAGLTPEREASDDMRYPFKLKLPDRSVAKVKRARFSSSPTDVLNRFLSEE